MKFPSPHFVKFFELMAPIRHDSEIAIVLTGHLLIEELLVAVVEKSLKHPKALSNHSFHGYLCLARALAASEVAPELLNTVETLNQMRNQLAHNLDASKYQLRRSEFLAHFRDPFPPTLVENFGEMWCALMALHTQLSVALDFDASSLKLPTILSSVSPSP